MAKRFVRCLAVAGFAVLVTMTWVTGAGAQVTNINTCQTLGTFGQTYRLTADLVACGDCLIVANNRITIDLQGHTISQNSSCSGGAGITDDGIARDQIIVKNGQISLVVTGQFDYGIDLGASTRTEVRNIVSYNNAFDGIRVGTQSIIAGLPNVDPKTCRATYNGGSGISGGDRVQVQDCNASWNGTSSNDDTAGIRVGNQCLVTRNIANWNADNGIVAGTESTPTHCTVSHNTANNNDTGIDVEGSNNVVTFNTTNNNNEEGLEVQCPSTVTNNNSSGNGNDYDFEGVGCVENNNN